jgi:hypothetical protein
MAAETDRPLSAKRLLPDLCRFAQCGPEPDRLKIEGLAKLTVPAQCRAKVQARLSIRRSVTNSIAAEYVDVQVFGVLPFAEIRHHARRTVLRFDLRRDIANDQQQLPDDRLISPGQAGQRCNMLFGHDHDMRLPMRLGVVEGQNSRAVIDNAQLVDMGKRDIALEIGAKIRFAGRTHVDTLASSTRL